jgi:hypothetical protein
MEVVAADAASGVPRARTSREDGEAGPEREMGGWQERSSLPAEAVCVLTSMAVGTLGEMWA